MTNQNKDNFTKSNSVHSDVKGDLFTSKLMRGTPISEEIFDNPTTTDVPVTKPAHSHLLRNILYGVTAAVIALLAFATFWFYRAAHPTSKTASDYGATTADIAALTSTKASTANGFVIINGNANVNGSVTADNFAGNGADLNNVNATRLNSQPGSFYQNADNIDAGTLSDARLSGNVALLDAGQSFTGTNSFANTTTFVNLLVSGTTTTSGAVTINNTLTTSGNSNVGGDLTVTGTTNINGLSYSWPGAQGSGILANDGTGNLAWQAVGACASCITNGGNAFGTTISVGTNDANALYLRTNGTNQVTLDTTGNLGIGTNPGYKLDVNGDVNVSAGNAFRIGGTAICTSGGCAASAGSTDYVQNSASLQTGVNFNFEIASINSVGGIIRAKAGQVADLQQWQSSGGVALAYVDAAGDFSANTALKINGTTVCTIFGCTAAGGSGVYIQNGTALQATANFNIQSAAAGSIGGIIRGAVGQTANLQEWQDSTGAIKAYVSSTGSISAGSNASSTGAFRMANTASIRGRNGLNNGDVEIAQVTGLNAVLLGNGASGITLGSATTLSSGFNLTLQDGDNIIVGTTNGTKFGTTTSQKIGFWGATPIVQPANTVALDDVLVNTGLRASGGVNGFTRAVEINSTGAMGTVEFLRVNTPTTVDNSANVMFSTSTTTSKGLVVQGTASQSANLQEWQASDAQVLAKIGSSGNLTIGTNTSGSANVNGTLTLQGYYSGGSTATSLTFTGGGSDALIRNSGTNSIQIKPTLFFMVINSFDGNSPFAVNARSGAQTYQTKVAIQNAGTTGLVVNSAASQTASLQEWQDANAVTLSKIGASGGITTNGISNTFGSLSAPTIGSTSTLSTGGTLAQNTTYWYQMTATNAAGETVGSASVSQLTGNTTATNTITLNWTQISGATGYKIYRNTSNSFGSGSLLLTTITNGTTITYTDTGTATSAGFPPTAPTGTKTVVQGWASQTANVFEIQSFGGTNILAAAASGGVTIAGVVTIQNGNGISMTGSVNGSTTNTNFVGATVQLGATPAAAGALRLANAASISWRNAANTGDKSIKLSSANVTDALDMPGSIVVGGTDATAGRIYYFNGNVSNGRTAASGWDVQIAGTTRLAVNSSGAVGITTNSTFTNGTVENFRVNTPTTVDNLANVIFTTSATTSKGLVIQGLASQTANLQEWQSSTGSVLAKVSSIGAVSSPTFNATPTGTSTYSVYYTPTDTNIVRDSAYWGSSVAYGISLEPLASSASQYANGFGVRIGNVFSSGVTTGNYDILRIYDNSFNPASGTSQMNGIDINPIISQSGTASGVTRGLLINPTLTSAVDFRGIEIANASGKGLWQTGASVPNYFAGNVGVGSSGTAGTVEKLRVNTPTTVDNSANTIFSTSATTSKGLVIQGVASQSANLFETQASTGVANFVIYYDGTLRTNGNGFQFWKDNTPSKAVNVGMAVPGSANGDNLVFSAYTTGTWSEKARIDNATGALEVNSTGTPGTVEKFRVNSPTTVDNSANVLFSTGATTNKGLVIQGKASQTGNLTEWQDSAGTVQQAIGSSAEFTKGVLIGSANNSVTANSLNIRYGNTNTNFLTTASNTVFSALYINNAIDPTWKGIVIRGNGTQSANLTEWQNSGGTALSAIDASGNLVFGASASSSTGAIRLQNATSIGWRNAANSGDITVGVNASNILQVTSSAADGSTVAQFNNAGATNCTVQPGGTGFACSSDARLKTNVLTLNNSSDIVNKLRGVSFNWLSNPTGQIQSGFIAQELMQVIPGAVSQDSNGFYVANYSAIVPYLVNAFQDSDKRLTTVEAKLNDLQLSQGVFNGGIVAGDTEFQAKATFDGLASFKGQTVFTGGATFEGVTNVKGRLQLSNNNTGSATVAAGATSVHVTLPSGFSAAPNVNLTPQDFVNGQYRVTHVTTTGFDIETSAAQTTNTAFYWQAF